MESFNNDNFWFFSGSNESCLDDVDWNIDGIYLADLLI